MRVVGRKKMTMYGHTQKPIEYWTDAYSLPDGSDTTSESFADMVWALDRKHCVACPFKIPERSLQFRDKR